jgi:hypothetical protein
VAKLLPGDVYAYLINAGFSPAAAVTMTAIAGGESGYNSTAMGDVGLQDNTWGPSVGLFQIRTLKGDTGRGTVRDIQWLTSDPAHQAAAAYQISGHGANFNPWTVYTTGRYQDFLSQATAGAGAAPHLTAASSSSDPNPFPTIGPTWLPWNWPSDAANAAANWMLGGVRTIVIEGLFVVLGLAVVGVGVVRMVRREQG